MDDRELRLIGPRRGCSAPLGPAHASPHGVGDDVTRIGKRHYVVEHHRDVAAKLLLDGNRSLRRKLDRRAIDVRTKSSAAFIERHARRPG